MGRKGKGNWGLYYKNGCGYLPDTVLLYGNTRKTPVDTLEELNPLTHPFIDFIGYEEQRLDVIKTLKSLLMGFLQTMFCYMGTGVRENHQR